MASPRGAMSPSYMGPPGHIDIIDPESQFQMLLREEKIQHDLLKKSYEILKEEQTKLMRMNEDFKQEIKDLMSNDNVKQSEVNSVVENLQTKLLDLENENKALKSKQITSETRELIRLQLIQELESKYNAKIKDFKQDANNYYQLSAQLKHELAFVKGELESERLMFQTQITEIKQRSENEIKSLQREREKLVLERMNLGLDENSLDAKYKKLHDQNKHLSVKIECLETENEEVSNAKDKLEIEVQNQTRFHAKQQQEFHSKISNLQQEKQSVFDQLESKKRQANEYLQEIEKLQHCNQEMACDVQQLKNTLESERHMHEMNLNEAKLHHLNDKRTLQKQMTSLEGQLKNCESDIVTLTSLLEKKSKQLAEAERKTDERISDATQHLNEKARALEMEKLTLEKTISQMESKAQIDKIEIDKIKENYRTEFERLKHDADMKRKEIEELKTRFDNLKSKFTQLEEEHDECQQLQQRIQDIELKLLAAQEVEKSLVQKQSLTANEIALLKGDNDRLRQQLANAGRPVEDNGVGNAQAAYNSERLVSLTEQMKNYESQCKELRSKYQRLKDRSKEAMEKLRAKLRLVEAEKERAFARVDALERTTVTVDEYNRLRGKLRDLLRKHQHYKNLLMSLNVDNVNIDGLDFYKLSDGNMLDASTFSPVPMRVDAGDMSRPHVHAGGGAGAGNIVVDTDEYFRTAMDDLDDMQRRIRAVDDERVAMENDSRGAGGGGKETRLLTSTQTTKVTREERRDRPQFEDVKLSDGEGEQDFESELTD